MNTSDIENKHHSSFYSQKSSVDSLNSLNIIFKNKENKIYLAEKYPKTKSEEEKSLLSENSANSSQILNDDIWENLLLQNNQNIFQQIRILKIYLYLLFAITIFQLCFQVYYDYFRFINYYKYILEVKIMYENISGINPEWLYTFITSIDFIWQVFYFPFAFLCYFTKKIRFVDYLNFLALLGIINEMMQAYIGRFEIYLFFIRFFNFTLSKMIFDLLLNLYVTL